MHLAFLPLKRPFGASLPKPDPNRVSGTIKVLLCDAIRSVQSILCSVTPLFDRQLFLPRAHWMWWLTVVKKCPFLRGAGKESCVALYTKCGCNPAIMSVH